MTNRREQLGRNRKVASPASTNFWLFVGMIAMCVAAWFAYQWFSNPARVFGARTLDCSAFDIEIQPGEDGFQVIEGCGKKVVVRCTEEGCVPRDPL